MGGGGWGGGIPRPGSPPLFPGAPPASQGLGTVLGYLQLAIKHGQMESDRERLDWIGMDGVPRAAWAVRYVMTAGCIDAIR